MIKNRFFPIIAALLFIQPMIYGLTREIESMAEYSINWKKQQLEIFITSSLGNTDKPLPSLKFSIESEIVQRLPYILLKGIELITIDSRTKGENFIKSHPDIIASIFDISPELEKASSLFSSNLNTLKTKYTLDIYPYIADLFIPHTRTSKLSLKLDFIPSADFTGIVIYVDKQLPMYGKQSHGAFAPSLFPKIYDEKLNLIMGPVMVDPLVIKETGTVGYQTLLESLDLARTGQNPLEIKARGIFGIHNTDILISTRDADKILTRQNNLDLIKQGKILIIYNDLD